MSYTKPDVEVLQKFQNLSPTVNLASLQTVIVGPSFKKLKDFNDAESTRIRLGAYTRDIQFEAKFPDLIEGAKVDEESLELHIVSYSNDEVVPRTTFKVTSEKGFISSIDKVDGKRIVTFTDTNVDFVAAEVKAGPEAADNDGDYVSFRVKGKQEYFEIQEVVDAHTLKIDDPDHILSLSEEDSFVSYESGNFGWMINPENNHIIISKRINHKGTVYISGTYQRTDYCDKLIEASSVEDLEAIFGAGEITLDNPLAYGMSKVLPYLNSNQIVVGVMVESDDVIGYQKAFEFLESQEVYCIVPLTTNPIVHQMLKEHVVAMSDVAEKKERIGLISCDRLLRQVKSGMLGRKNKTTGVYDMAAGFVAASGESIADDVVCQVKQADMSEEHIDQEQIIEIDDANRMMIYLKTAAQYELSYMLKGSDEYLPIEVTSDGYASVVPAAEKEIISVKFVAKEADANAELIIYALKSVNEPKTVEVSYAFAPIAEGAQSVSANTILPQGMRALKIRCFSKDGEYAENTLPFGMKLSVTANEEVRQITTTGMHTFEFDMSSIVITNSAEAAEASKYVVDVMMMENGGTYKLDTFKDELATFVSDEVESGDELVLVYKMEDGSASEKRYRVARIIDEDELVISGKFDEESQDFVDGQFDAEDMGHEVFYRIETPVLSNKRELARAYAAIGESLHERRISHIFAPAVGVIDDDGNTVMVPGYYFACAYAAATQSYPPQRGFTNMNFAGFTTVKFTNWYFSESQLDIIASGGTTIVIQKNLTSPLTVRHQLTTDMSSVQTKEYSVTKDVDYMAKVARETYRPYIGRYVINEETLNMLYKLGSCLINRWIESGVALPGSSVGQFSADPDQEDKVFACFNLKVPIPLNYIRLIFII